MPAMWPHFVNLLARSWNSVLAVLSTSTLAIILFSLAAPVATFFVTLGVVSKLNAEKTFVEHLKQSVIPTLIGFAVPLVLLILVFGWRVVATVYNDHQELVANAGSFRQSVTGLVDPKSRDDQITELKSQITQLKGQIDDYKKAQSPEVRTFLLNRAQSAGPKMEYVLTTGKMRSPVEITTSCDFPITAVGVGFLSQTGGFSMTRAPDERISPTSYRVAIQSPVWSPSTPLWVVVALGGNVDRLPSCAFRVP